MAREKVEGFPALTIGRGESPKGGDEYLLRFETFGAMLDAAEVNQPQAAARMPGASDWNGETETIGDAIALGRKGWTDIRPEIESFSENVLAKYRLTHKTKARRRFDVSGDSVDVGRFLSGAPECFSDRVKVRAPMTSRTVTVVVDTWISSGIPAAHIRNRGAALVALCDVLAEHGYALEVWLECSVLGGEDSMSVLTCVKGASDPWDINAAMFALAHPAMIRRVLFGTQEQMPMDARRKFNMYSGGGYGGSDGPQMFQADSLDANLVLKAGYGLKGFDTIENAAAWIGDAIESLGVAT